MRLRALAVLFVMTAATIASADDSISALQLVSSDAAVCIEIPQLEQTWVTLESSRVGERFLALPPSKRFFESSSFERWQQLEGQVAKATGNKLFNQVRSLFARSLVLAIYLPPDGKPQGVLIGEAEDAKAISAALSTWNFLEPESVMITRQHRSYKYKLRKRRASDTTGLFVSSSDRWFAISDQEDRIQNVIDRFVMLAQAAPKVPVTQSINELPEFSRNRERLKGDGAAYIHINARAWDRSLDEAAAIANSPVNLASVWKHVTTIAAKLHFDRGVVFDSIVEVDTTKLPQEWADVVASFANDRPWKEHTPNDAMVAFCVKGQALTLAGTEEANPSRLTDHSQRFFPDFNQLIWFDLAQIRKIEPANDTKLVDLLARIFGDDAQSLVKNLVNSGPLLDIFDSLFVAGRIESDHIRVTFGGGLDSK